MDLSQQDLTHPVYEGTCLRRSGEEPVPNSIVLNAMACRNSMHQLARSLGHAAEDCTTLSLTEIDVCVVRIACKTGVKVMMFGNALRTR